MSKTYFTVAELTRSDTAGQEGIDNTPGPKELEALKVMIIHLSGIRELFGSPVICTSGFRCPFLNMSVGGSATSAHVMGWAADIMPQNGDMRGLMDAVLKYFASTGITFDQIIWEETDDAGIPCWIHIGIFNRKMEQRRQIFETKKK